MFVHALTHPVHDNMARGAHTPDTHRLGFPPIVCSDRLRPR